jgi:NifB/MoaA-like Fe-S oxidoreductase
VTVAAVAPRTPAAGAGLARGDRIVAVNGHPLRDAIDFQFHAGDERLELTVERDGVTATKRRRRHGPGLGLELAPPRPCDIATCANKCVFCFIHQLPKGMRKSLYVKDDDFRLSFLHGNYITLSDLDEASFERIIEQHLSPLYISVHATDPDLRYALLGRPRHSAEILAAARAAGQGRHPDARADRAVSRPERRRAPRAHRLRAGSASPARRDDRDRPGRADPPSRAASRAA